MKRYDRTWPVAVLAIAMGALSGRAFLAPLEALFQPRPATGVVRAPATTPSAPPERAVVREPVVGKVAASVAAGRDRTLTVRTTRELEGLLDALRTSTVASERRDAAALLGATPYPARVLGALMIAVATDEDAEVRTWCARSIGRLGSPEGLGSLEVAARLDADPLVRAAAVDALAELGGAEALPVLTVILSTDRAEEVRAGAAKALLRTGDPEVMRVVAKLLEGEKSDVVRRAVWEEMSRSR